MVLGTLVLGTATAAAAVRIKPPADALTLCYLQQCYLQQVSEMRLKDRLLLHFDMIGMKDVRARARAAFRGGLEA